MSSRRLRKRLFKLKRERDSLELDIRQWGLKLHSLILNKEGGLRQTLVFNDGFHEDNEVNGNLPTRLNEHEVEGLQVSDLKPCGVVERFGQLLIQKEWPHSKQE